MRTRRRQRRAGHTLDRQDPRRYAALRLRPGLPDLAPAKAPLDAPGVRHARPHSGPKRARVSRRLRLLQHAPAARLAGWPDRVQRHRHCQRSDADP